MSMESERQSLWPRSLRHPYFSSLLDKITGGALSDLEVTSLELYEAGFKIDGNTDPIVVEALGDELRAKRAFANYRNYLPNYEEPFEVDPKIFARLRTLDTGPFYDTDGPTNENIFDAPNFLYAFASPVAILSALSFAREQMVYFQQRVQNDGRNVLEVVHKEAQRVAAKEICFNDLERPLQYFVAIYEAWAIGLG